MDVRLRLNKEACCCAEPQSLETGCSKRAVMVVLMLIVSFS